MDASISASLGAMGSLIRKLDMLLGEATEDDPGDPYHRLRLRLRFKDGVALVHLLRMDLEEISTYLEDLSEVEDPPLTAKCWMKEVRELSYDIEDYIDSFVRPARNTNIKTRSRSISKISHVELAHLPKKKLRYKRASNKISDFIIRAHDGKQRYTRYELDWHNLRRRYVPVGPMRSTPYQESTDLVIDGQMSNLIGTLASDGDHQLKVVSILGSGGIGKTTLVRVLYNKIRRQFQLRAFIQMTRKPDVKIVLRQLLTQIQRQQSHEHCEDLDLISKVRKHLQNKR